MKKIQLATMAVALAGAMSASATIQIGTGLDTSGPVLVLLNPNATELNWDVGGLATTAKVQPPGVWPLDGSAWVPNTATAQWIVPSSQDNGYTTYTRTLGAGTISGRFSSDNPGALFINQSPNPVVQGTGWPVSDIQDWGQWIPFNVILSKQVNTVEFRVNNLGGPAGVIVEGTFIPVPEPTTVVAGALLLLPFGASAVRILRRKQTV